MITQLAVRVAEKGSPASECAMELVTDVVSVGGCCGTLLVIVESVEEKEPRLARGVDTAFPREPVLFDKEKQM